VPISHGQGLHARLGKDAKQEPYWAAGAGHDDVYEVNPGEFLGRMRRFLGLVESRARDGGEETVSGGGGGGGGGGVVGSVAVAVEGDVAPALVVGTAGAGRGRGGRNSGAPVRVAESSSSDSQGGGDGPMAQVMARD
jgi:hypothetical protein